MPTSAPQRAAALLSRRTLIVSVTGLVLFAGVVAAAALSGMRANGGFFCYALDDAYIHLALAREVAFHGVWGLNWQSGFASASSSPGWTLLLAGLMKIFGSRVWLPLALDSIFCGMTLLVAAAFFDRWLPVSDMWIRLLAQLGLVLLTPMTAIVLGGMEHGAQIFFALLAACLAAEVATLPRDDSAPVAQTVFLCASLFFAAAFRYETIFLVAAICVVLVARRRWASAAFSALASGAAPLAFGIYFHRHSPFFLPFSVLSKANISHLHYAVQAWTQDALGGNYLTLIGLMVGALALLFVLDGFRRERWTRAVCLLWIYVVVAVLHISFALVGFLMRYEAYLVAIGWLAIALGTAEAMPAWRRLRLDPATRNLAGAMAVLAIALTYPAWLDRAVTGIRHPVQAMRDRYFEHLQPAFLIAHSFNGQAIVANDIGAISYYTNARVLDPIGLGSVEPLLYRKRTGSFTADDLDAWARGEGAKLAVLENGWHDVAVLVPQNWVPVETWRVPRNVVYMNRDVTFYAIAPADAAQIRSTLDAYQLPPEIERVPPDAR